MKTTKKQTQCQRLLAYLKKHRKGITTMEAFRELGITCLHKRIGEIDGKHIGSDDYGYAICVRITRTRERTASGSIVTRYKLAR
jgi:hypothetical protein